MFFCHLEVFSSEIKIWVGESLHRFKESVTQLIPFDLSTHEHCCAFVWIDKYSYANHIWYFESAKLPINHAFFGEPIRNTALTLIFGRYVGIVSFQ